MNPINQLFIRAFVVTQCRLAARNEQGAVTAEYGTVALVAVALALAVMALFTTGKLDDLLQGLMSSVLKQATNMTGA